MRRKGGESLRNDQVRRAKVSASAAQARSCLCVLRRPNEFTHLLNAKRKKGRKKMEMEMLRLLADSL